MRFGWEEAQSVVQRTAPLTPFQRPLVLMLFLIVPMIGAITVTGIVMITLFISNRLTDHEHGPVTVKHETLESARKLHKLTLGLVGSLREFDDQAEATFGESAKDRHRWSKDGEPVCPPYIQDFIQHEGDRGLLRDYADLCDARLRIEDDLRTIEDELDEMVSTLPDDATLERVFQAERMITHKVAGLESDLAYQRELLDSFGEQYRRYLEEMNDDR